MKACVHAIATFLLVAPVAFGRVGDMAADYHNRYGDPIAESFDNAGHGIRLYRSAEFKEVRVTFAADKSLREKYTVADGVDKEAVFARIRTENGWMTRILLMLMQKGNFRLALRSLRRN